MLSSEQKSKINSLTDEEMLQEINLGNKSRFQNKKFLYLQSQYQLRVQSKEDEALSRSEKREEESNELARKANRIASLARDDARSAKKAAWIAAIMAIIATTVMIIEYIKKPPIP